MLKEKIKELCVKHGTTVQKLEDTLCIGNGVISRWDKSSPKADNLEKIADYFGVSVDYLLGRTDDPTPTPKYLGDPSTGVKLSPEEAELVDMFRKLDDEMKKVALGQAKVLSESNKR